MHANEICILNVGFLSLLGMGSCFSTRGLTPRLVSPIVCHRYPLSQTTNVTAKYHCSPNLQRLHPLLSYTISFRLLISRIASCCNPTRLMIFQCFSVLKFELLSQPLLPFLDLERTCCYPRTAHSY